MKPGDLSIKYLPKFPLPKAIIAKSPLLIVGISREPLEIKPYFMIFSEINLLLIQLTPPFKCGSCCCGHRTLFAGRVECLLPSLFTAHRKFDLNCKQAQSGKSWAHRAILFLPRTSGYPPSGQKLSHTHTEKVHRERHTR